ncbi:MAG: metal-dependent hydrolase [Gemmatimonadota bacterium]|nr:MAG: metal-dependent hydrolase [Gemmatimonadota bacterium]
MAETGLRRRTALGTATLLIGANLPDLDVLAYVASPVHALWLRRGVTHGLLALALLPLLLAAAMLVWDRLVRRRGGRAPPSPVVPSQVVLLSLIAVATHPVLDFMNTYGMRWLMPFSGRWFYADTLFIVDPWIWGLLAAGILIARRKGAASVAAARPRGNPARWALLVLVVYIAAMAASNVAARGLVRRSLVAMGYAEPQRLMAAPRPLNPLGRWVVIEDGGVYRFGTFDWLRHPRFVLDQFVIPRNPSGIATATQAPTVRRFLSWARFPYYVTERRPGGDVVHIGDARYTIDPTDSWAAITVPMR